MIESCRIVAGIAIQNALEYKERIRRHRLNEQLLVARDIQSDFMPSILPWPDGFRVAGKSEPALYVGGDYYDVVRQPCGGLIAIIADVSGKGIQAAMRMSAVRAAFYSLSQLGLGPGETLARLNNSISEMSRQFGQFVTACCLVFDAPNDRVIMASAGHESPLRYSKSNGAEFIEVEGGLPLGLRSDQVYEEYPIAIGPGESLFLYTDGITDAMNDDKERFGVERMVESFEQNAQKSAAELLDKVFEELETYKGDAPWSDDLTALAIDRGDGGSS